MQSGTARFGMARSALAALALSACLASGAARADETVTPASVLAQYSDIAHAGYEDSLVLARKLDAAVDALIAHPSAESLKAARDAWTAARVPYQQTEAYRFGNAIVDDWEGRVNAWPLDEGLIDYVDSSYGTESDENVLYTANVIANPSITVNGKPVDATHLTPDFLSGTLQEAGKIEANVATGYHAIEFLLWGQDLNGTGPGAGGRPWSDYDLKACTGGHCDRRAAYLKAASSLLVTDLSEMAGNWTADGAARKAVLAAGDAGGLSIILTGMGSLSYGELAGQRMKLGLLLHDPEQEHDCFSDNTHHSALYDAMGIRNVYRGSYRRIDGSMAAGPSLSALVKAADPALDAEISAKLDKTVAAMQAIVDRADAGEHYDQLIGEGNAAGNALVQAAIDDLIDQTKSFQRAVNVLKLNQVAFEGSDSLDNPGAVFQ